MSISTQGVFEEFDRGLRAFVAARVGDRDAVEDIIQDVYLKIHSRIETLRNEDRLGAWVYAIARNAIHDYYRHESPTAELTEVPYLPDDPTDRELEQGLERSVRGMLECLSPEDREALVLTEYGGLRQRELAERLGISVSGAKSRVQRARTKLRSLLLACCHFELDRHGRVMNYYPRRGSCCLPNGCDTKGETEDV